MSKIIDERVNRSMIKSLDDLEYSNISSANNELVRLTELTIAGALLLGYSHAEKTVIKKDEHNFADESKYKIATSIDLEPVPFEEAIDFMKGKVSMTKDEWLELEPKLRFRAFTVARLAEADYIEAVRGRLVTAMKEGETMQTAWNDVKAIAKEDGSNFKPGYWETVYRTNIQTAYSAGRLMQYKDNRPPAWELLFIEDGRTSDTCKSLVALIGNGKALPSDHSFWKSYGFPPYHFNCRTSFRAVYDYEIGKGTSVENVPMKKLRKNFKPAKGFGENPIEKESFWKLTPAMVKRATRYGVINDIVKQARDLDMQSYFPELLRGFKQVYKGKKQGYVQVANNWDYNADEMMSAKRLADEGHKVYMLKKSNKAPSADMIIDDEIGEMKHITTIKQGTIRGHIKYSGEAQRARTVYINVKSEKQKTRVLKIMKEEIKNLPLKKLLLDYKGVIRTYNRNFFE